MSDEEMKDLAARMAIDEAAEGNFAAAAELENVVRIFTGERDLGGRETTGALAAAAAQGVDLYEETAGYDRHTGEWTGPGPRPVPHTHNPETGEPLNFTERPEDTVRRFAGQNLELQAEIETLRRLVESGHELITDEWGGVEADSDGGRWLATYAEWKATDHG